MDMVQRKPSWLHPLLLILCLCAVVSPTPAAEKKARRGAKTEKSPATSDYRYDEEGAEDDSASFIIKNEAAGTDATPPPSDKYMTGGKGKQAQKFEPFTASAPTIDEKKAPRRRGFRFWRRTVDDSTEGISGEDEYDHPEDSEGLADADSATTIGTTERPLARARTEPDVPPMPSRMGLDDRPGLEPWRVPSPAPPTRAEVEDYRVRLENRLLERYNNLPDHAGNVAKVTVVLSKPLVESLDGSLIRAEFDQMAYDPWGKRIPALEKEYYVVTFGAGGARQVRSDPSIRVGLDLEKTYSERAPLAADPFRNVQDSDAFRPAPTIKMPEWWRPDYPELNYP